MTTGEFPDKFKYIGEFTDKFKYTPEKQIGSGAYGDVWAVVHPSGNHNAVKVLIVDDEFIKLSTLREIMLLSHFTRSSNVNVIHLLDVMYIRNCIYIVIPLLDTDLYKVICSSQSLSTNHITFIMHQILQGLGHIHACSVVHRDLKPSNIMMNRDYHLQIADFGLARGIPISKNDSNYMPMTTYVATRYYRAPEVLCEANYSTPIDVWAAGCIFAELLERKALFRGKNPMDQLAKIIRTLGMPSKQEMEECASKDAFKYMSFNSEKCDTTPFSALYPYADENVHELLTSMICWSPKRRCTAAEAANHPLFESLWRKVNKSVTIEFEPCCEEMPPDAVFGEIDKIRGICN